MSAPAERGTLPELPEPRWPGVREPISRGVMYSAAEVREIQLAAYAAGLAADGLRGSLRGLSDRAYCDYINQMRRAECLGWEQKVKSKQFGEAELKAHTRGGELLGRHRAFAEAAALLPAQPAASLVGGGEKP